jgi:putrescine aminotransferase
MSVSLNDETKLTPMVDGLKQAGYIVDYFLFNDDSFRIAPPLIISEKEIIQACNAINEILDRA